MKRHLFILSILLCISPIAEACDNCASYQSVSSQCSTASPCYCTDPGATRAGCMSQSEYCEAFGNVGAR